MKRKISKNERIIFLLKYLLLPLGTISIISLWLTKGDSANGFWSNLATELIGIIITVFYVDLIFQWHYKLAWQGATVELNKHIREFSRIAIIGIKESTDLKYRDIWQVDIPFIRAMEPERRYFETILSILVQNIFELIPKLENENWEKLIVTLNKLKIECTIFLDVFGQKLTPEQYQILLSAQLSVNSILKDNDSHRHLFNAEINLDEEIYRRKSILESASIELVSIISELRRFALSTF